MARPADWTPLGLSADPVPGDPERVSQEAAHLSRMATTLTDQIAALRKIAAGGADSVLVGQYAEKIRLSAADLAGQLGKVVGRYQKVSSALSQWAPDLEQAQARSSAALNEAEGPYRTLQIKPGFPASGTLTPAQQQEKQYYDRSVQRAQSDLDVARAMLARAVTFRDERASHWAGVINSAIDDGVKDSFWDGVVGAWDDFAGFIGRYAWLIKDICTVLEIAATALAFIALFATGVGWLLAAAFVVMGLALAGRFLLAATGHGSWLDVAMDAFALLTLGIGGGLTGAGGLFGRAAASVDEAILVGDDLVAAQRAASWSGRAASFFGETAEAIFSRRFVPNVAARPFTVLAKITSDVNEVWRPMPSAIVKGVDESSAWQRIFNGGHEPALLVQRMKMLVEKFPGSPEIRQLAGQFRGQIWQLRGVVGAGVVNGAAGLGASGVQVSWPGLGTWQSPRIPGASGAWDRWSRDTTASLPTIAHDIGSGLRGFATATGSW
jgi:hypothetical protein